MTARLWISTCALAVVTTACAGGGAGDKATHALITKSSLAGIHLGDSRPTVEALIGTGHIVEHSNVGDVLVAYPKVGLTVFYAHGQSSQNGPSVYWVKTRSPRYRTSRGTGVGSTLAKVRAIPGIVCSGIPAKTCETIPDNGVPGLEFDVTQKRVSAVWLVVRSN